jgi:hypothetical protein
VCCVFGNGTRMVHRKEAIMDIKERFRAIICGGSVIETMNDICITKRDAEKIMDILDYQTELLIKATDKVKALTAERDALKEGLRKLHKDCKHLDDSFSRASHETPEEYDMSAHAVTIELLNGLAALIQGGEGEE